MNWISIITKLLTAVDVIVCVLLILLVLLQRPKNEGLGAAFGGDTASNLFGAQTTNVLANLTRWLGGIFLGLCLTIAILGTFDKDRKGKSVGNRPFSFNAGCRDTMDVFRHLIRNLRVIHAPSLILDDSTGLAEV